MIHNPGYPRTITDSNSRLLFHPWKSNLPPQKATTEMSSHIRSRQKELMNIFITDITENCLIWSLVTMFVTTTRREEKDGEHQLLLKKKNALSKSYTTETDSGEFNRNH